MSRVSLVVALGLCGCSLLNAPDESRIPRDAGSDVLDIEVGPDASVDAPDAAPDAGPPAEDCDTVGDEDGNGLSDCADFACSGHPACCNPEGGDDDIFTLSDSDPLNWLTQGNPNVDGENIQFSLGDRPDSITSTACYPLAQGAKFQPQFEFASLDPSCMGEPAACDQYAAFYVSSVGTRPGSGRITSEFSVTVYASNFMEFRLGGELFDSHVITRPAGTAPFTVFVTFSPTTDERGESRLAVTVEVDGEEPIELGPQLYADDLTPACSRMATSGQRVPGLLFGIEGTGAAVEMARMMRAEVFECTNPSLFRRDRNELPIAASDVGGDDVYSADWASDDEGAIAWPELISRGDDDWQVLASLTDQQPLFEPVLSIEWDTASARNDDFASSWVSPATNSTYVPNANQLTAVYINVPAVLYVVARVDDELHYGSDTGSGVTGTTSWVIPDDTCDEVSHPALALQPAVSGDSRQLVLFYVCRKNGATTIRRQRRFVLTPESLEDDIEVLNVNAFGQAASARIKDMAVLIDQRVVDDVPTDEILVRLWVVGQDSVLGESLLLATGQYKLSDTAGALALSPYAGNPVGTAATLLEGNATLEGVAVERDPRTPSTLRFLISRRLDLAPNGRRWDFVPLTQVWGAL